MEVAEFSRAIAPWLVADAAPVGAHLALALRQAIATGMLTPGDRLPPERALAAELNVSRPTISAVVDDLRRSGLLASRQGSGTWVAPGVDRSARPVPFAELVHQTGLIDLAAATAPDASLLPPMRVETNDLLAAEPANGLDPVGVWLLREQIAARARRITPDLAADNVVVTSGAHQALALLVATLVPRGSTVLVEETTYGGLVDLIRSHGAHPLGIERDEFGPTPDSLRTQLEIHAPALVVLIASVHSPSGTITPDHRAADLAAILAKSSVPTVIDETYAELEFTPSAQSLARSMGRGAIRVGSLSKTLWTGLGTGWLIAPPGVCDDVVSRRWSMFDLGPSVPSQLFALQAMATLDELVDARRRVLRTRCDVLVTALAHRCPDWKITPPEGGLALWAALPGRDSGEFAAAAARRGVATLPGSACRFDRSTDSNLRLCFDRPPDVLEAAVERLAEA